MLVSAADLMRRLLILLAAVSTPARAADVPHAEVDFATGNFVPFVADSNDNVGLGNDIAVDADGVPYVSYFGYEAQLDEGEIATARPVGAPFIPGRPGRERRRRRYLDAGGGGAGERSPRTCRVPFGPAWSSR